MSKFKVGDIVVAKGDYDGAALTGCKGKIVSVYCGVLVEFEKPFYAVDGGHRLGHDGENDKGNCWYMPRVLLELFDNEFLFLISKFLNHDQYLHKMNIFLVP